MAEEIGTDSRTFRKFLRSDASPYEPVGQGSRYVFDDTDIADLKKRFAEWGKNRRGPKAPQNPGQKISPTTAKKTRKSRGVEKEDPLAGDDLLLRTTMSIADRQRRQGLICDWKTSHPKVRGLELKCSHPTVDGTHRCSTHKQLKWCGDWEPVHELCGPGHYCGYHNGDISDEEFEALRVGAEIDEELGE
jgi:hypothetical protein